MNFSITATQQSLMKDVADFAKDATVNKAKWQLDDYRRFWRQCGDIGLIGCALSEELGGLGKSAVDAALMMEAAGYGTRQLGPFFAVAAHTYAGVIPLAKYGSKNQLDEYLPSLVKGELIAAHAITEPQGGSEVLALQTHAGRTENGFIINGEKAYISNAPIADIYISHALTNPNAGFLGLSCFIVPADNNSIRATMEYTLSGLENAPISGVLYEDCRIHDSALMGIQGQGAMIFTEAMNWERVLIIALYVGAMRKQLEETIAYAKGRRSGSGNIASHQAVSHKLADMKTKYEAARLLTLKAAEDLDNGKSKAVSSSSMGKNFSKS